MASFFYPFVFSAVFIRPNDPAISYSPYNWGVTASNASTINSGAYFRVLFTGNSATLHFDTSLMVYPASQLYARVDNSGLFPFTIAPIVTINVPKSLTTDVPYHYLEILVKSTTETRNRWFQAGVPSTRIVFNGLILEAGATVALAIPSDLNILVYGDSITEGVLTLGSSAALDTDHNDASVCWSYRLGALLGSEVGVVGFGATGLSLGGSGNVPALVETWDQLWDGIARSFDPAPDLIVLNEGTNDGTTNIVAPMIQVLNSLLAACPLTPIAVLRPFNGTEASNLQAAVEGCNEPARVYYVDTTGFYDETYGGDLHPRGPNDIGRIAPQVASALRPILATAVSSSKHRISMRS